MAPTPASAGTNGSEGAEETVQTAEMAGCVATFSSYLGITPNVPVWTSGGNVTLSVSCATSTAAIATSVAFVPVGDVPVWAYTPADADACTNCTWLTSAAYHASVLVVGACQTAVGTAVMAPNAEPVRFFTSLC